MHLTSSAQTIGIVFVAALAFASALSVIYTKHLSRKLVAELEVLEQARDDMNVEWGRLQIEHSTWASHDRIQNIARTELGLHIPSADAIILVRP
jgi:cell division protein FtsL